MHICLSNISGNFPVCKLLPEDANFHQIKQCWTAAKESGASGLIL